MVQTMRRLFLSGIPGLPKGSGAALFHIYKLQLVIDRFAVKYRISHFLI